MGVTEYIKETQGELKRVSWPRRKQVVVSTLAIILVSVAMSILLGFYDFAFSSALGTILVSRESPNVATSTGGVDSVASTTTLPGAIAIPIGGLSDSNTTIPGLPGASGL